MKTITYLNIVKTMLFLILGLCTPFIATSQCPTISDPTPPPICDASGFRFSDLNAYATDQGNGIRWYDVSTGGSPFNANQLVREGIYYADDISGSCGTRSQITIDFQVDRINQNLDAIYCTNENPTVQLYIDEILTPLIPSGGSVEVYTDSDLIVLANGSDAIPTGGTSYYIVFVDSLGCKS